MEGTSLLSNTPKLPLTGHSSTKPSSNNRKVVVNAKQGENEGKSTDDNPNVLRMRIKKMKPIEASKYQDNSARLPSSSECNERERSLLRHDLEDVIKAIELLQSLFAKSSPGLSLGVLVLLAMSLSLSHSELLVNILKVAKGLLAGGHICIDIDL